jgi:hypothetical protein
VDVCQRIRRLGFPDRSDETEALARDCFDQALGFPAIADCGAGGIHAGGKRSLRHNTPFPYGGHEVVFTDNALPVADQVIENVEDLWRNGNDISPAMQLAPIRVEHVFIKEIAQVATPVDNTPPDEAAFAPVGA